MELQEIRVRKEDQTFDFKSIQIAPKALAITIVAFANADGGDIAVGVSDKTRKIEGVDQHTEKLNELLRVPLDFCNPIASTRHENIGRTLLYEVCVSMYFAYSNEDTENEIYFCFCSLVSDSKKVLSHKKSSLL